MAYLFNGKTLEGDRKTVTLVWPDIAVGSCVYHDELARAGFTVLHLAKIAPDVQPPHRKVVLIDGVGNSSATIQEALCFGLSVLRGGGKLAVCCRSGANRAPACAAAVAWLTERGSSLWGVLGWMQARRPEVGQYKGTTFEVEIAAWKMLQPLTLLPAFAQKVAVIQQTGKPQGTTGD